jgi:subtilase family serine protease
MARMLITQALHMQPSKRFATSFGMLTGISRLALGVFLGFTPSCALDDGSAADPSSSDGTAADDGEDISSQPVCSGGRVVCHAHIRTFGAERSRSPRAVPLAALPAGYGPADLQSAYGIDPTKLATTTAPVVAITDAFGYPNLEADLAVYRQTYGLPPCTTANGCLKIVNQQGQTTNLPPAPPANDDWTVETALDVDMVSAACPRCNILVVQATDDQNTGLDVAQNTAASLGATVISDSWGSVEQPGQAQALASSDATYYKHPGIAIFVASGDAGYDDTIAPAGRPTGPGYPATSQYTIAVGGTHLVKAPGTARGWTETAWAVTTSPTTGQVDVTHGAGGSGCSLSSPKPAYQSASPCTFKATSDIAVVGDPATGVAVYNTNGGIKGGWGVIGGTSAAAPFVAAIFAATGNGSQTSGKFIADNVSKMFDVTSGTNGTCPAGQELLCNAKAGWDGPTGFGTPNVKLLMPATATGPGTGSGGGNGNGGGSNSANGAGSGSDGAEITGGCSAGGGAGLLLGLALLGLRRRKR